MPNEREEIDLPEDASSWCVSNLGAQESLEALKAWQPDIIYSHKVEEPGLEAELIKIAPSVYFAHDYQGMCISGTKTFSFPVTKPCGRRFDRRCLAHYFPHRCGGRSPLTMFKLYRLQAKRLELLRRYSAIVTHTDHMLKELIDHGLPAHQAYRFPYYVGQGNVPDEVTDPSKEMAGVVQSTKRNYKYWNLLFSGRMEFLKGGHIFLEALPGVLAQVKKPLRVTFAGDGRARADWQRKAKRLEDRHENLKIEFIGWASKPRMNEILSDCDLLVVPSLWPEPFGLVGPEAGVRGVPVAAFAVGGIADWLENGTNGFLAPGNPPTADGLATAVLNCLRSPEVHARLSRNAVLLAQRFNIKNHLDALLDVFEKIAPQRSRIPTPLNRVA